MATAVERRPRDRGSIGRARQAASGPQVASPIGERGWLKVVGSESEPTAKNGQDDVDHDDPQARSSPSHAESFTRPTRPE